MSESVDPWQPPQAASTRLFLLAVAAPTSAVRYIAGHAALALLPALVVLASGDLVPPGRKRGLVLMIATLAIWHWFAARQQPRQVQLKWQPGEQPGLSGRFDERAIAINKAVAADSVKVEGNRLVFRTAPTDAAETLSIDCDAFPSTGAEKLRSVCAMVMAGDGSSLRAFAEANRMKCRERRGEVALLIIESRWTHAVLLFSVLTSTALIFLFRHALFG